MIEIQAAYAASPPEPLNHARVCHDTIARITGAVITGSTETAGFPDDAAANSLTYDRWLPTALPATWQIDALTAQAVDYIAIASHALFDGGITVFAESSTNGSAWDTEDSQTPTDNSPIVFLFAEKSRRYWRIRMTGTTPQPVGVVYIGKALNMARPNYGGHSPFSLSRTTKSQSTRSVEGQFLGKRLVQTGFATSFAWTNLAAAWYRTNFDPFVEDATQFPFFIGWNPSQFPEDVGYVWLNGNVSPTNMGVRDLMQVSINVTGLGIE